MKAQAVRELASLEAGARIVKVGFVVDGRVFWTGSIREVDGVNDDAGQAESFREAVMFADQIVYAINRP